MRPTDVDVDVVPLSILVREISTVLACAPKHLQSLDEDQHIEFFKNLGVLIAGFIRKGGDIDTLGRLLHELSVVDMVSGKQQLRSAA